MKMIVVPLVFACMTVGIAGMGNPAALGRVGLKTFVYFFTITSIAIVFGLLVGSNGAAGLGRRIRQHAAGTGHGAGLQRRPQNLGQVLLAIVPDNIVLAMSQGKLLSVLFSRSCSVVPCRCCPRNAKRR